MSNEQQAVSTEVKHVLAFPRIHAMMSGASYAEWQRDEATLVYVDGTRESCPCSVQEFGALKDPFAIVSFVQDRARKGMR
jgi:hypothetical protein